MLKILLLIYDSSWGCLIERKKNLKLTPVKSCYGRLSKNVLKAKKKDFFNPQCWKVISSDTEIEEKILPTFRLGFVHKWQHANLANFEHPFLFFIVIKSSPSRMWRHYWMTPYFNMRFTKRDKGVHKIILPPTRKKSHIYF